MKMGSETMGIPSTHSYDRSAAGWNHVLGQAESSDVVGTHLTMGREPYRVIHQKEEQLQQATERVQM